MVHNFYPDTHIFGDFDFRVFFDKNLHKTKKQNLPTKYGKRWNCWSFKKQTKRDMLASINPNDPQDAKEKIDVIKEIEKLK